MIKKPKVLFYTDCVFLAGSERMLLAFNSSYEMKERYETFFAFRYSSRYKEGLISAGQDTKWKSIYTLDPTVLGSLRTKPNKVLYRLRAFMLWILQVPASLWNAILFGFLILRFKPDLVHLNNGGYPGSLSVRTAGVTAKILRVPAVVMVVNNLAVGYESPARWLEKPFDAILAKSLNLIVTGSRVASKKVGQVLHFTEERLRVINNGVSIRRSNLSEAALKSKLMKKYQIAGSPSMVSVVANHEPRKGHRTLIAAVSILVKQRRLENGKVVFLLEGAGPDSGPLKSEVSSLGIDAFFRFVGSESNVHDFMAGTDLFVLPSISHEDFPNVISEAMGLGIPVIASNVGGIPEQIDNFQNGLLVKPGDEMDLANAIEFALSNPEWRAKASIHGLAQFESSYRVEIAVRKYIELYDELIHGGVK